MISIKNLSLSKGGRVILNNINLTINKNEYFVLLGPTGSGKTLLAESIAGVEKYSGEISLADGIKTAIVYQDFALLPHLTVRENIEFPLRIKKEKKTVIDKVVAETSKELGIASLLDKKINTLSGGEKQKTALARALVFKSNFLILDEPLSAIDPPFRRKLYGFLNDIKKKHNLTILHITHNFEEALYLSDRVAILNNGQVEQQGDISQIFKFPKSIFVASFVGADNIIPIEKNGSSLFLAGIDIPLSGDYGDSKYVVLHAEDIILSNDKIESSAKFSLKGNVLDIFENKYYSEIKIDIGYVLNAKVTNFSVDKMKIKSGQSIFVTFKESSLVVI